MICTPNTGHPVWGYFYALDLLSQVKKLAQHSNSIFAICNSQLLPTNQKCGLLSYPKKTKNPNLSPIGNRFGFFLFGGRGWMSQAALLKTAHWAVFALSSATAPQLFESPLATLYKLPDKTETPVSLQHWSSWWSEATQIRTIAPWGILGGNFIESDGFCAVFVVECNQNFFII